MALRQAARQLLGNRCLSVVTSANGGALQSRLVGQLRPFNATAAARGGAGLPVERGPPVSQEVPEHDELQWDDGSKNPEPVLDDPAPKLTPGQGAQWLGMGLGFFGLVAFAAKLNDKQSSVPFAPKEFPFNNLAIEMGRVPPPK